MVGSLLTRGFFVSEEVSEKTVGGSERLRLLRRGSVADDSAADMAQQSTETRDKDKEEAEGKGGPPEWWIWETSEEEEEEEEEEGDDVDVVVNGQSVWGALRVRAHLLDADIVTVHCAGGTSGQSRTE